MKVLIVTPWVVTRTRTRIRQLIMSLDALGHEVELFSVATSAAHEEEIELLPVLSYTSVPHRMLGSALATLIKAPFRRLPLQALLCGSRRAQRELVNLLETRHFDVLIVATARAAVFAETATNLMNGAASTTHSAQDSGILWTRDAQSTLLRRGAFEHTKRDCQRVPLGW